MDNTSFNYDFSYFYESVKNKHSAISIFGLQCDNTPECDFEDKTIKLEDYPLYINQMCPKCNKLPLITKEQLDTVVDFINSTTLKLHENPILPDEPTKQVKMKFNATKNEFVLNEISNEKKDT